MNKSTRRSFLQQTSLGLAAIGTSGLLLRSDAHPTPEIDRHTQELAQLNPSERVVVQVGQSKDVMPTPADLKKVTPFPYGPFYRTGAPFRGKLSLPGEPGTQFVLSGRVWAFDTKKPLGGAVLDFWHVDLSEKYSNGTSDFRNRGRLVSSENGYYELESIRPIPYRPNAQNAPDFWRCAHFHLLAVAPGYKPLITEIHFHGDAKKTDPMYRLENAIAVEEKKINGTTFQTGVFDVVLERE